MAELTIAAFARTEGVGVESIRRYQRRGMLRTTKASAGSSAQRYQPDDVRQLGFIRLAQSTICTLDQIAALLALDAGEDGKRARKLAGDRLAARDAKMADLQATRAALQRLVPAGGASAEGPCPLIAAFAERHMRPTRPYRAAIAPAKTAP